VKIETVGSEPLVEVVHHPIVVQRDTLPDRVAQQDDPANLAAREIALEGAPDIVPDNSAHAARIAEPAEIVARLGQDRAARQMAGHPYRPRRGVLLQMEF